MGSRSRRRARRVAVALPLVIGAASGTVLVAGLSPAAARTSTSAQARGGLPIPTPSLPGLPSLPLPTPSLPSLPLPTPSLPGLPLPAPAHSATPQPTSPAPSGSAPGSPRSSHSGAPKHNARKGTRSGPASSSSAQSTPVPLPWGQTPPVVTLLPPSAVGYALPVPASVVAAHPALIGEGRPAPGKTQAAGPVTLQVPAGTPVDAVTAGTPKILAAAGGTSTIVLSGADGATYTYRNVTNAASLKTVRAGTKLGVSGPGGLTFSISVPDVRGLVDADEALQSWASGFSVNVRSLPSTIAAAITSPPRGQVLLLTDPGASAASSDLSRSMAGPLVRVTTDTLTGKTDALTGKTGKTGKTGTILTAPRRQLIVVLLANGTPASAARLAERLPAGHDLLWVSPPGTTPKQAAAYRALAAAHPGFRVESLPPAVTASQPPARTAATTPANTAATLATATLTAAYAATAYRLDVPSPQADTALSWAEEQLGKPYKWAAAGPDRFDCSGLTMDALAQSGITLTHNANDQWRQTKAASVPVNKLQPGDLVFFAGSDGTRAAPGHVGIYAGDGEIIDAPYSGANVRFDRLSGIAGYTGATDPYSAISVPGAGLWAGTLLPGTLLPGATPGRLSQYQSFAQGLADSTWGPSQFPYLYQLWERESGWNPAALNPVSGAFGIPQSLPAGKMAAAGLDWETDPYTQIMWGISYIGAAYGDPQAAWAHELAFGWY